jgi:hypothetical protein
VKRASSCRPRERLLVEEGRVGLRMVGKLWCVSHCLRGGEVGGVAVEGAVDEYYGWEGHGEAAERQELDGEWVSSAREGEGSWRRLKGRIEIDCWML